MSGFKKLIFRMKKFLTISTTSTSATWSPSSIMVSQGFLIWDVSGDITPTSQIINDPTFNLSANTGTVNMNVYNPIYLEYLQLPILNLTLLDISKCVNLIILSVNNNSLSVLDISNNPLIALLQCQNNSFSATVTNSILTSLVAGGLNNGTLHYRNNETGQGVTDRATLITRGWTITNYAT